MGGWRHGQDRPTSVVCKVVVGVVVVDGAVSLLVVVVVVVQEVHLVFGSVWQVV